MVGHAKHIVNLCQAVLLHQGVFPIRQGGQLLLSAGAAWEPGSRNLLGVLWRDAQRALQRRGQAAQVGCAAVVLGNAGPQRWDSDDSCQHKPVNPAAEGQEQAANADCLQELGIRQSLPQQPVHWN